MRTEFDLTGFVNFPYYRGIKKIDCGRTQVYLVAFQENSDFGIEFEKIGNYCGDDMSIGRTFITSGVEIDSVVKELTEEEGHMVEDSVFKNKSKIKLDACLLLGWSNFSYSFTDRIEPWRCNFRDLTNEGRKLYYSLKKLHNSSEIRILTFNNIKQ